MIAPVVNDEPVPITEPAPQPPSYQFQEALVPNDPPVRDKVTLLPEQISEAEAEAEVAGVEGTQFVPTVAVQEEVQPLKSVTV